VGKRYFLCRGSSSGRDGRTRGLDILPPSRLMFVDRDARSDSGRDRTALCRFSA